jgi:hypothetical protein
MLDALDGAPGFVLNGRSDLVAVNTLGRALFAPLYAPTRPAPSACGTRWWARGTVLSACADSPAASPAASPRATGVESRSAPVPSSSAGGTVLLAYFSRAGENFSTMAAGA